MLFVRSVSVVVIFVADRLQITKNCTGMSGAFTAVRISHWKMRFKSWNDAIHSALRLRFLWKNFGEDRLNKSSHMTSDDGK
jgi:hypothetical protein